MDRTAAVLAILTGLGFGLPGFGGTFYFAAQGEVWRFLGFPTYGNGPFVDCGVETSVPLLLGFVVVCAAEVGAGVWLLRNSSRALWLQFTLLPFELVYWWGFALPFGFALGLARAVAAVLALARAK